MKKETLSKRIKNVKTRSLVAKRILQYLAGETATVNYFRNGLIRPCKYSFNGKRVSVVDYRWQIMEALTSCKIRFETGNDAPRGGAEGNYIKILTKITD